MLKIIFVISALLTANAIIIGKLFVFNRQKPVFVGNYAASIGALFGGYSIIALMMMTVGGLFDKLIMLAFSISPYLIGKITTYKNISFFTFFQVVLLFLSALYVIYCID